MTQECLQTRMFAHVIPQHVSEPLNKVLQDDFGKQLCTQYNQPVLCLHDSKHKGRTRECTLQALKEGWH